VHVFVDQLIEEAGLRARKRRDRHERCLRKHFIEIIKDHRRFYNRLSVMDQCRHNGVGVELHVGRVELITAQGHQMFLVRELLFGERNSHLLGANGIDAVVQFEHGRSPLPMG